MWPKNRFVARVGVIVTAAALIIVVFLLVRTSRDPGEDSLTLPGKSEVVQNRS